MGEILYNHRPIVLQGVVVSPNPDFTSILVVEDKIFSITHYESPRPGVAYLSELEQHQDGLLTVMLSICSAPTTLPC
jgi:hypothetical protein